MRILKDKILHCTKTYNVPQLFYSLTTCLGAFYEARITDAAIGHWEGLQNSRFLIKDNSVKPEGISKIKLDCVLILFSFSFFFFTKQHWIVNVNTFPRQGWRLKETFQ